MTTNNPDVERINQCLQHLGEHFDSVHIFATRDETGEKGGTITIQKGVGNWYARYGQIVEWITCESEQSRIKIRNNQQESI